MNGLDLLMIVAVVVLAYLWLEERDRRRAERDEQLREWLAGRRPR